MSHVDSKDDELIALLRQEDSDDSKESDKPKPKKSHENKEGEIQYETNDEESPDSEW